MTNAEMAGPTPPLPAARRRISPDARPTTTASSASRRVVCTAAATHSAATTRPTANPAREARKRLGRRDAGGGGGGGMRQRPGSVQARMPRDQEMAEGKLRAPRRRLRTPPSTTGRALNRTHLGRRPPGWRRTGEPSRRPALPPVWPCLAIPAPPARAPGGRRVELCGVSELAEAVI